MKIILWLTKKYTINIYFMKRFLALTTLLVFLSSCTNNNFDLFNMV